MVFAKTFVIHSKAAPNRFVATKPSFGCHFSCWLFLIPFLPSDRVPHLP